MGKISEFRILDLFAGAGGFSYGMHLNEHFKTVVATDFNEKALDTFKRNMPDTEVILGDISNEDVKKEIIDKSIKSNVNMIIGGPSCQGFSMKGLKLGLEDKRNYLFVEFLKIVEELEPEVFVIENVKSIMSSANGWFREKIIANVGELGYHINCGVLNAKEFGVPQRRERAIFICSKNKNVTLPIGNVNIVTVRDAISDLAYIESGEGKFEQAYTTYATSEYQKYMRANSKKLFNHIASNHKPIALQKLKLIPPECGKEYLPLEMRGKQQFKGTWGRLKWDYVSPTIDTRFDACSNGTNSHPFLHRAITPREAARIQSFPDDFIFYGSKVYIRSQIGNAVPPLLAKAIADNIWNSYLSDDITYKEFNELSDNYEKELDSTFKKKNGIFYTDLSLVKTIIDFLNIPKDSRIIDPNCGTGSFLYDLKQRGYTKLFGCDFDNLTVKKCIEFTKLDTISCIDTIGNSGDKILNDMQQEKFDYIIGNPPYAPLTGDKIIDASSKFVSKVKSAGNNLFIGAIYRMFELVKKDGFVTIVIPKNMLHISSYRLMRDEFLKSKRLISVVELGIHFKTVRGEQIVLTFQNCFKKNNKIKFYIHKKGTFLFMSEVYQDYYNDEILSFTDNKEICIFNKLKNMYPKLEEVCVKRIRRGRDKSEFALRGKQIRKFGFKDITLPKNGVQIFIQNIFSAESGMIASYAGELVCGETVTIVELNNKRMAKYILGLLNSRLCNYFLIRFKFNNSRLTIHTDAKYLNDIPIVIDEKYLDMIVDKVIKLEIVDYMGDLWFKLNEELNDLVYRAYKINPNDRKYIELEMRKISAAKWYRNQE